MSGCYCTGACRDGRGCPNAGISLSWPPSWPAQTPVPAQRSGYHNILDPDRDARAMEALAKAITRLAAALETITGNQLKTREKDTTK